MPVFEIEVSQEIYDAMKKACHDPGNTRPVVDPLNPRITNIKPLWMEPEDFVDAVVEPAISNFIAPHIKPDAATAQLQAQKDALEKQIADARKSAKVKVKTA